MMAPARRQIQRVVELAERVQSDIHRRQLRPGERYLSTAETAKMLRVDTAVANRALQLLVKRNVLRRRQRVGTFVAEGSDGNDAIRLDRVHLLMNDPFPKTEGWLDTDAVLAMQSELPGVQIQFHVVPSLDETEYLEQVIREALRSRHAEGFLLMRSSLTTQRLIAASGLPAVVFGHTYASVKGLPFADRDQGQMGRLLAEYLLGAGHRRIVTLMRHRLLPGDHMMIDAVRDVLDAAGLPAGALVLRCLPHDGEEVRDEVRRLLLQWHGHPACGFQPDTAKMPVPQPHTGKMPVLQPELPGVLARPPLMADAAMEAIGSLGLESPRDVAVAVADYFQSPPGGPPYAVIRPARGGDPQGARLGRVVALLAHGQEPDPKDRLSPVRLQLPGEDADDAE